MSRMSRRCLAVAAGLLLDRVLGELPAAVHPVAGFGRVMERVERVLWADRRVNGLVYAAAGVAAGVVTGLKGGSTATATATVTWVVVAGRQLRRIANRIGKMVQAGDLEQARTELPSLVGRNPSSLDASGIAAAVIESVAENSVDAVIAPVFWAAVAGAPGAAAYRAINTMDAMVGHRNERYRNFGWAAARLDDAANYVPARIFASLVAVSQKLPAKDILTTVRRDAATHPSPNAGVAEAAMAAALQRQLGGPLHYGNVRDGSVREERPLLGDGPRPHPKDVRTAIGIANRIEWIAVALLFLIWAVHRICRHLGYPSAYVAT
ncbi:MAG: adenosylcobinamide-phosphate synthase CbiB [Acidimicrobiaceae bacterium]|nr:adenosylcobinamide-phosphate synthase CbiB [Acidimicrobiaceae bacterium]